MELFVGQGLEAGLVCFRQNPHFKGEASGERGKADEVIVFAHHALLERVLFIHHVAEHAAVFEVNVAAHAVEFFEDALGNGGGGDEL